MIADSTTRITTVTRSVTRRRGVTVRRVYRAGTPAQHYQAHLAALRLAGARRNTATRPLRVATVADDGAQVLTVYTAVVPA